MRFSEIWRCVFPHACQVRVVRFYVRCAAPRTSCSPPLPPPPARPSSSCQLLIAVIVAGHHLPALDPSGRRWTSSASSWSQWSWPDLICQLLIAVGLAGLQPARVWALWASPDFNRRESERCGPRRTSTSEIRRAVGLAGLQPARFGAPWASPDFNQTSTARNKAI